MLKAGDEAPNVMVGREGHGDMALAEFWRERTIVVAFLRHFG